MRVSPAAVESAPNPTWRGRIVWPGMIFVLLAISLTFSGVTVYFATTDPSFAVEENYYQKALKWDEHMADQRASDALGWAVECTAAEQADPMGRRSVVVSIKDAQGEPLADAEVQAQVFHQARASEKQDLTLDAAGPGVYIGTVTGQREGWWQVRLRVTHGEDAWLGERHLWLDAKK